LNTILLIIHLFVTIAMIGVVLIQRSEGGGLGIGSSQGMGSFMSGRGTANLLTRATAVLATIFMALSLLLAVLNHRTGAGRSILDTPTPAAPVGTAPAGSAPASNPPVGTGSAQPAPQSTPAPAAPAPAAPAPAAPSAPSAPTN
jgi:preprotein translocase subunit SecG